MKPQETKDRFIQLRAEGKSYAYITATLNIAKATCTEWERELKAEIDTLKRARLEELYEKYAMAKEARIRRLGETLDKINAALDKVDFADMPPEKLLDYKLKYAAALKEEYAGDREPVRIQDAGNPKDVLPALNDLLDRVRRGDIPAEQASREAGVLAQIIRAMENVELKNKLEALEAILENRDK